MEKLLVTSTSGLQTTMLETRHWIKPTNYAGDMVKKQVFLLKRVTTLTTSSSVQMFSSESRQ